LLLVRRNMT